MPARISRPRPSPRLVAALTCALLFGCAQVERTPEPAPPAAGDTAASAPLHGRISTYGNAFAGRKTASGETFDPSALTMAHRTLPFGTRVRVTNLENRRSVEVVVNDRGPFVAGRIADLSEAAARRIDMLDDGVVDARLEILQLGNGR